MDSCLYCKQQQYMIINFIFTFQTAPHSTKDDCLAERQD